jgi:hypothetical protein
MIARLLYVQVTGSDDGLDHRVSQQIYDEGVGANQGKFMALCGKLVLAAPLITQAGRTCPLCIETIKASL